MFQIMHIPFLFVFPNQSVWLRINFILNYYFTMRMLLHVKELIMSTVLLIFWKKKWTLIHWTCKSMYSFWQYFIWGCQYCLPELLFEGILPPTLIDLHFEGILHPKMKILSFITYPPCRSKPVKALFVLETQFKIFWMKTGRLVTVPLTAK